MGGEDRSERLDYDRRVILENLAKVPPGDKIRVWINYTLTGLYPQWIADVFFSDHGIHVVIYPAPLTLLSYLLGIPKRDAETLREIGEREGFKGILARARRYYFYHYDEIEKVEFAGKKKILKPYIAFWTKDGKKHKFYIQNPRFDSNAAARMLAQLLLPKIGAERLVIKRVPQRYLPRALRRGR